MICYYSYHELSYLLDGGLMRFGCGCRVSIYDYQAICDIWREKTQAASTIYNVSRLQ